LEAIGDAGRRHSIGQPMRSRRAVDPTPLIADADTDHKR
jgi:hypothetical protein